MALGEAPVSGEFHVIVRLLERGAAAQEIADARGRSGLKWTAGTLHGSTWIPIPDAPQFDTEADALGWADQFLKANPESIKRGLEGIAVRRVRYANI